MLLALYCTHYVMAFSGNYAFGHKHSSNGCKFCILVLSSDNNQKVFREDMYSSL